VTQLSLPLRLPVVTRRVEDWNADKVEHLADNGDGTYSHHWHLDNPDDCARCRWCALDDEPAQGVPLGDPCGEDDGQ